MSEKLEITARDRNGHTIFQRAFDIDPASGLTGTIHIDRTDITVESPLEDDVPTIDQINFIAGDAFYRGKSVTPYFASRGNISPPEALWWADFETLQQIGGSIKLHEGPAKVTIQPLPLDFPVKEVIFDFSG